MYYNIIRMREACWQPDAITYNVLINAQVPFILNIDIMSMYNIYIYIYNI